MNKIKSRLISIIISGLLIIGSSTPVFGINSTKNIGNITEPHGNKASGVLQLMDGTLYHVTIQEYISTDSMPNPGDPLNNSGAAPINLRVSMPNEKFDLDNITLNLITDKNRIQQIKDQAISQGEPAIDYLQLNNGSETSVYQATEKIVPEGYNYEKILDYLNDDWSCGELVKNERDHLSRLNRELIIKSVEGHVFKDINGNGIWDKTDKINPEPGLKNVALYIVNGDYKTTVVTGDNGYFKKNLPSGNYEIQIITDDSVCTTNNEKYNVTLNAKQISNSADIGLISKATGLIKADAAIPEKTPETPNATTAAVDMNPDITPSKLPSDTTKPAIELGTDITPGGPADNKKGSNNHNKPKSPNKPHNLIALNKAPIGVTKLPKTGGIPGEIFYLLGIVIILLGVVLRKKIHKYD